MKHCTCVTQKKKEKKGEKKETFHLILIKLVQSIVILILGHVALLCSFSFNYQVYFFALIDIKPLQQKYQKHLASEVRRDPNIS